MKLLRCCNVLFSLYIGIFSPLTISAYSKQYVPSKKIPLLEQYTTQNLKKRSTQEPQEEQYTPIVLVHGILGDEDSMIPAERLIYRYMPGVYVKNVELGIGKVTSFFNMYTQVDWLRRELENDPKLANGFNLIAHSQGGLVARYYIQRYNKPQVFNFITWGSPHQGVFGTPGTYDNTSMFAFLNLMELYAHRLLYSHLFQRHVSFASYWRDTLHYESYLKKCRFLPYLNNEVSHSYSSLFKHNLCTLQNFVMVASTDEDVIEPVASCHFGFYKIGSINEVEGVFDSPGYQEDSLGLKTLQESGRLHLKIAHSRHGEMQHDEDNFLNNTLPFLLLTPPSESDDINLAQDQANQDSTFDNAPFMASNESDTLNSFEA